MNSEGFRWIYEKGHTCHLSATSRVGPSLSIGMFQRNAWTEWYSVTCNERKMRSPEDEVSY